MDIPFYAASFRRHGAGRTLFHAAYRATHRVTGAALWEAMLITPDKLDKSLLADPRLCEVRRLDAATMRDYANGESAEGGALTEEVLRDAASRGDDCFASFAGDELASFSWYATAPMALPEVDRRFVLRFDPTHVYMYNAFTLPQHRGERLHALGIAAALEHYARLGRSALVSYVDASNLDSLKACRRLGFDVFGHVAVVRTSSGYRCRTSAGCERYGFRIVEQESSAA